MMDIDPSGNSNWLLDYTVIDDISVAGADFPTPFSCFSWGPQVFDDSSTLSTNIDCSFGDVYGFKKVGSQKRARAETYSGSGSKACREKIRRDKLNERFLELGFTLEPRRPPKVDKAALLSDAIQAVVQLRNDAQKLKESNENLQEKIKELKAEKNELRDEKQRLKADKEKLELQVKAMSTPRPGFVPQLSAAAFAAHSQSAGGGKMMPYIGYPGVAMWQFMPPAAVDTSQDHILRPPVA